MTYNSYSKFKKGDIVIIKDTPGLGFRKYYGMVMDSDSEGKRYSVTLYSNIYDERLILVRHTFNEKDLDRVSLSGKFCYSMVTLQYLLQSYL